MNIPKDYTQEQIDHARAEIAEQERRISVMEAAAQGAVIQYWSRDTHPRTGVITNKNDSFWNWKECDYKIHPQNNTYQAIREIKYRLRLAADLLHGINVQYRHVNSNHAWKDLAPVLNNYNTSVMDITLKGFEYRNWATNIVYSY